jgi:hypothetical protein
MLRLDKKGQSTGMITGIIFGITALVIAVIISFVIVSVLDSGDLMAANRVTTTVTNEAGHINLTTYSLAYVSDLNTNYQIVAIGNATSGQTITSGNYSLSTGGVLSNASTTVWDTVKINYTYETLSNEEQTTDLLSGNFTGGINNISGKLPTVLLIAAIVLILGILAVLVGVWQRMRMGGGNI